MAEEEPIVLELESDAMWTLADDGRTLSLNMVVPEVPGLSEPLTVHIEFDRESVDVMIERLTMLRVLMPPEEPAQ